MSWDAIGTAAELLGALGVIASLVSVAMQVRYSNRASAASTSEAISRRASS